MNKVEDLAGRLTEALKMIHELIAERDAAITRAEVAEQKLQKARDCAYSANLKLLEVDDECANLRERVKWLEDALNRMGQRAACWKLTLETVRGALGGTRGISVKVADEIVQHINSQIELGIKETTV